MSEPNMSAEQAIARSLYALSSDIALSNIPNAAKRAQEISTFADRFARAAIAARTQEYDAARAKLEQEIARVQSVIQNVGLTVDAVAVLDSMVQGAIGVLAFLR
jgi:hypothetical protein